MSSKRSLRSWCGRGLQRARRRGCTTARASATSLPSSGMASYQERPPTRSQSANPNFVDIGRALPWRTGLDDQDAPCTIISLSLSLTATAWPAQPHAESRITNTCIEPVFTPTRSMNCCAPKRLQATLESGFLASRDALLRSQSFISEPNAILRKETIPKIALLKTRCAAVNTTIWRCDALTGCPESSLRDSQPALEARRGPVGAKLRIVKARPERGSGSGMRVQLGSTNPPALG